MVDIPRGIRETFNVGRDWLGGTAEGGASGFFKTGFWGGVYSAAAVGVFMLVTGGVAAAASIAGPAIAAFCIGSLVTGVVAGIFKAVGRSASRVSNGMEERAEMERQHELQIAQQINRVQSVAAPETTTITIGRTPSMPAGMANEAQQAALPASIGAEARHRAIIAERQQRTGDEPQTMAERVRASQQPALAPNAGRGTA